jgi:ornithine cyclodeaminase/alanine dehydrogenase-like protein (mu-crystallin family)
MATAVPTWIPADEIFNLLDFAGAVHAIDAALHGGFDPAGDPARQIVDVSAGQLLLMPSQAGEFVGTKLLSVSPDNPARGRERIQALYVLMDAETLTPSVLLDGTALTTLRTPAVSAVAAQYLAPDGACDLVVFGSGPQAEGHVAALRTVRELGRVRIVARNQKRAAAFVERLTTTGLDAAVGSAADVSTAQIVVAATTAADPLFDGALVGSLRDGDALVIAVGSHEPDRRELDSQLLARAQVVVEDTATALREAGDVIIPIAEGVLDAAELLPLRRIVTGVAAVDRSRPRVFKSVGMSWQDLIVAAAVHRAAAR